MIKTTTTTSTSWTMNMSCWEETRHWYFTHVVLPSYENILREMGKETNHE